MRRLFVLLSLCALTFAACESTEQTPTESLTPEIAVTPTGIITMPATGGKAEISYHIINPIEGSTLEATTIEAWINDIAVTEERVTFNVERNNSEQRIGIITLSYAGAEDISIAVQQNEVLASGDVRLTITSDRKTIFEATGGSGKVEYMLECDEEGAMPDVETDVEWITIDEVDATTVNYTVNRSLVEERRTGRITLSFAGKSAEAIVEQKAAELLPVLSADNKMVYVGEPVTFRIDYAEEDVTSEATIHDYYTNEVVANPYTSTEAGEKIFYAMYNNRRSKVLTINILAEYTPQLPADPQPESYAFNQRMLIVDHTGVGCGYCPNMKSVLKSLEEDPAYATKFNIVYAYSFSQSEVCYSSASKTLWYYYEEVCKSSYMPLTGYPSATFNFCRDFAAAPNHMKTKIDEYWDANPTAALSMAATIVDGKVVVNAEVKSSVAQNIHIAIWVLEDDIYARQSGGTAEWMNNHHSVLRDCLTGASKSDISGIDFGYVGANSSLNRIYEFDLFKAEKWNSDNFKLFAVISAPNGEFDNRYEVINTVMCEIDGSVEYDYK